MDKIRIIKTAVSLVVGFGTTQIVKEIIKNNITPEQLPTKVAVTVAAYVLGGMITDASKCWTDSKIDDAVDWWTTNITKRHMLTD